MNPFALLDSFCDGGSLRRATESFYSEIQKDRCRDRWTAAIAVCSGAMSYQSGRLALRLCSDAGHLATLVGAVAAGLGTLLAVGRIVLFTLVGTGITNFRTQFADAVGKLRAPAHQRSGSPADGSAIAVGFDAVGHFRHVRFTQARIGTTLALLSTFDTCFDTSLKFLVRHRSSPS